MPDDLADCLRSWRDGLDPAEAGLTRHARSRAPGLRREEVAEQAGISVNYLMRLEQGHARTPSLLVVSALARALRLNPTEAAHLDRLAGHADSTARVAARHITPSVQRILARFDDVPVIVIDPAWTIVAANAMARALLGDDPVGQNAARRQFVGPKWVERELEEEERFEREVVGDLHLQIARHPDDTALHALVAELRAASERFATLWADPPASASSSSRKTFHHPTAGTITLDCDHLEVVGSDLRVVLWTATPGSPDATALALLSVVGLQRFATS
ncbi:MAG: helix-turn-helix domain-containing protein [Actinomycetota bacterium]|nr:helix-turn-helix domain-containing protein [Actinomycetota bacterium]